MAIYIESLPDDIWCKLLDRLVSDGSSVSSLFLTSKKLNETLCFKIFNCISSYLPRTLTEQEKKLPLLQQISIVREMINQKDSKGMTPLVKATLGAKTNQAALKAISLLVSLGADINEPASNGWTPIKYAEYWHIDSAAALLKKSKNNFFCKSGC